MQGNPEKKAGRPVSRKKKDDNVVDEVLSTDSDNFKNWLKNVYVDGNPKGWKFGQVYWQMKDWNIMRDRISKLEYDFGDFLRSLLHTNGEQLGLF